MSIQPQNGVLWDYNDSGTILIWTHGHRFILARPANKFGGRQNSMKILVKDPVLFRGGPPSEESMMQSEIYGSSDIVLVGNSEFLDTASTRLSLERHHAYKSSELTAMGFRHVRLKIFRHGN